MMVEGEQFELGNRCFRTNARNITTRWGFRFEVKTCMYASLRKEPGFRGIN
jgi:hypothetical protein